MNSLKVYLRSGYVRVFAIVQVSIGILLCTNALKLIEEFEMPTVEIITGGILGTAMIAAAFAVPRRLRDQYRHLPGLLLLLAGAVIFWNSLAKEFASDSPWAVFLFYAGIVVALVGLVEPVLNIRPYVFFSKRGLRVRKHAFTLRRIAWKDIEQMDMGDKRLEVHLKNGATYTMQPARHDSQHLRSRVDEMKRVAMQSA